MRYPQTIRELLQAKRHSWADLQVAIYVGPVGLDGHRVTLGGVSIIIPSTAGAVTFRPGDQVLVAAVAGSRQRSIIGRPPAGLGGQSAFAPDVRLYTTPSLVLESVDPTEIAVESVDAPVVLIGRDLVSAAEAYSLVLDDDGLIAIDDRVTITLGELTDPQPSGIFSGQQARDALVTLDASVLAGEELTIRMVSTEGSTALARALVVVPAEAVSWLVLWDDSVGGLELWSHDDTGANVEQLASRTSPGAVSYLWDDGHAAYLGGVGVGVLDMITGSSVEVAPSSGWSVGSGLIVADDTTLHWIEYQETGDPYPDNNIVVRVMSDDRSLSSPSAVAEWEVPASGAEFGNDEILVSLLSLTLSRAYARTFAESDPEGGGVFVWASVHLLGSSHSVDTGDIPTSGGSSVIRRVSDSRGIGISSVETVRTGISGESIVETWGAPQPTDVVDIHELPSQEMAILIVQTVSGHPYNLEVRDASGGIIVTPSIDLDPLFEIAGGNGIPLLVAPLGI